MKVRNIKKTYSKRIKYGGRYYLSLRLNYKVIGVESNFLTRKSICDALDLTDDNLDAGFVNHFRFHDYNEMKNGIPLEVTLQFREDYLHDDYRDNIQQFLEDIGKHEDTAYIHNHKTNRLYYIESKEGYLNPKYKDGGNEKYWLEPPKDYTLAKSDCNMDLLQRFVNNKEFGSQIFSGNFLYRLLAPELINNNKYNKELLDEFAVLADYCKTIYKDFYDDYVDVTFAIRYKEYVEPFLKELKRIIKNNKIKTL